MFHKLMFKHHENHKYLSVASQNENENPVDRN